MVIWQVSSNGYQLQKECNDWLNTPAYHLDRDSSAATSGARPMTMVFDCNFERVYEDKSKSKTADTISYYKFNLILEDIFVVLEIL
jgi:hypothetical protein